MGIQTVTIETICKMAKMATLAHYVKDNEHKLENKNKEEIGEIFGKLVINLLDIDIIEANSLTEYGEELNADALLLAQEITSFSNMLDTNPDINALLATL